MGSSIQGTKMAAFGKVEMNLQLSHGSKKYSIKLALPPNDKSDVLTVDHLTKAVTELTEIKPANQKLIYKGRSLIDPSQTLVGLGVRDGAKIMLLGKKPIAQDTEDVKKLLSVEITVEKHEVKMLEMIDEMNGISKGYLDDELVNPALSQLNKKVGTTTEALMKQFEVLDSLRFEEDNRQAKAKRKNVADKLNKCLDKCEALSEQIKEMTSRSS